MLLSFSQYYIKSFKPAWGAFLTKLVYSGNRIKIGKDFHADSVPRIIVDPNASLEIGNNVEFRRNVEIRVHGTARVKIGNDVRIDRGVRILAANKAIINIEDGTRIGLYTVFNGGDSISIGKKVLISGYIYLQTSMHGHASKEKSVKDQGFEHAPIQLADDVWLGTHSVILPGVNLGKGAIVASNSVVTKSFDDYEVVAGVPARIIKER